MSPKISVKVAGEWVPMDTLTQEQQTEIKRKVASVFERAIRQQVDLLLQKRQITG